jgi:hypothetical protein
MGRSVKSAAPASFRKGALLHAVIRVCAAELFARLRTELEGSGRISTRPSCFVSVSASCRSHERVEKPGKGRRFAGLRRPRAARSGTRGCQLAAFLQRNLSSGCSAELQRLLLPRGALFVLKATCGFLAKKPVVRVLC